MLKAFHFLLPPFAWRSFQRTRKTKKSQHEFGASENKKHSFKVIYTDTKYHKPAKDKKKQASKNTIFCIVQWTSQAKPNQSPCLRKWRILMIKMWLDIWEENPAKWKHPEDKTSSLGLSPTPKKMKEKKNQTHNKKKNKIKHWNKKFKWETYKRLC